MSAFSDIELLPITKAVKGKVVKTARDGLEPGEYQVEFDARISGVVRVGQDYEARVPNKAKPWNIIATLLEENAKLAAAAGEVGIDLDKLVKMAETVDPEMAEKAKKQAEEKAAALKQATVSLCKGKVTADLKVEPATPG